MKTLAILLLLLAPASLAMANTAPTIVIQSAAMRPGTTLMDVVYRVNDPDDATVKTRALAFVDGVRSFANVLKPVTFVEGTAAKLGDAISSNTNHTLTWDVAADWNIDLGQVKFEVLARDGRGLLPIDWITIPAAGGNPSLVISKNVTSDTDGFNALFWLYAAGDEGLMLVDGLLKGTAASGRFNGLVLATSVQTNGKFIQDAGIRYVQIKNNSWPASYSDITLANYARAGTFVAVQDHRYVINQLYPDSTKIMDIGSSYEQHFTPNIEGAVIAISAGSNHGLALKSDGSVIGWGDNRYGQAIPPTGLAAVVAISAGSNHSLALKGDGTVIGWGSNSLGQITIPAGLAGVTAIVAGDSHSLALKSDGTVVGWGFNTSGQATIPAGLSAVIAIAAGRDHSLALKSDGTVVGWGSNSWGQKTPPVGMSGVSAICAGSYHSLALKSNGTVVGWGYNTSGQRTIPSGLNNVTEIAAGSSSSHALKSDGTVVTWGSFSDGGQRSILSGLSDVSSIESENNHIVILRAGAP